MTALLFDLDGTLIDSAPVILETFGAVLAAHGLTPAIPLDHSLIGPPLKQTLARLVGSDDPVRLTELADAFRARYDTDGIASTNGYPGLATTLTALASRGHALFIVTNKRIAPSRAILGRLGVLGHFAEVASLDAFTPPLANKGETVAHICRAHGVDPNDAYMIGDTSDDAHAAACNGMRFIAATYGYGAATINGMVTAYLERLDALPQLLGALHE